MSAQQFLQNHFLDMWEVVARHLGDLDAILGFEVCRSFSQSRKFLTLLMKLMNEPHRGYIDLPSLHKFDYNTDLHLSYVRKYPTCPSCARSHELLSFCAAILHVGIGISHGSRRLDTFFPSSDPENFH